MKNSTVLLTILFLGTILFSCKKEDNPSKEELLTGQTWVVKSKIVDPTFSKGGFVISDILVLDTEEVRNYSFKYNMDGTMVQYDHLNQVVLQTKWSFNADKTAIIFENPIVYNYVIVGDLSISSYNIESIKSDQITATVPFEYEGANYLVTIVFNPK